MFIQGNAEIEGKDRRGWFIGHFMPEPRNDIEIKWSHHKIGEGDTNFSSQISGMSISILIRGKVGYQFTRDDVIESATLTNPGDYVMWEPGVGHTWQVIEETDIITVRWPSLPNDAKESDEPPICS